MEISLEGEQSQRPKNKDRKANRGREQRHRIGGGVFAFVLGNRNRSSSSILEVEAGVVVVCRFSRSLSPSSVGVSEAIQP